jgi:N-acyl-phosphatidylethanolamine-hydrolysing phospholipase D
MDPVFSERSAPVQFAGPKRYRPVPITIDRIPHVDAVVISHNHYDHLDYNSVIELSNKISKKTQEKGVTWFVGKGTAEWFESIGVAKEKVHELNWWESKKFKNLEFVFTPAQHWCRRGLMDRNAV